MSYYEYDEDWDILESLFSVDICDLQGKTLNIFPGSIVRFDVFIGACVKGSDNVQDNCNGFTSDEILTVQFRDKFKDYSVDHIAGLVISEENYE